MPFLSRCGLCGAIVEPDSDHCPSCRLGWDNGAIPGPTDPRLIAIAQSDRIALSAGHIRIDGLNLDLETLRMLASRFDRTASLGGLARLLLGRVPARLLSTPVRLCDARSRARASRPDVALGCITKADELDLVVDLIETHTACFAEAVIVVDGAPDEAPSFREKFARFAGRLPVTIDAHPLDRDFGRQRNRVQQLARSGWLLHLDTDETPDPRLAANLGWIVADAERHGDRVVGFPRINLVDGVPSAFYPDTQYRLIRSDIRFTGKVHESPLPGLHWRRIHHSLGGAIRHRLSGERVRARSVQYEAIATGAGKPGDEALLLEAWPSLEQDLLGTPNRIAS